MGHRNLCQDLVWIQNPLGIHGRFHGPWGMGFAERDTGPIPLLITHPEMNQSPLVHTSPWFLGCFFGGWTVILVDKGGISA